MKMTQSFNLLDEPWIRVTWLDGEPGEVSLLTAFRDAVRISGIHGEIASQDMALLRLLLAIAHRATGGPEDLDDWRAYWANPEKLGADAGDYLERYRDRFDLRDPEAPFFQVAGIHAKSGKISDLESLIADVPNGEPFFTTRIGPGLDRMGWAEAARWLVHVHAFDPSGIRSGAVGDPRVKGGKVYPIGPGWTGQIGVVAVEGKNLAETILLNTVVTESLADLAEVEHEADLPPWEKKPDGPAGSMDLEPIGPVSCYTWQTRRALLHGDEKGVTGLFLGNGDKATPQNRYLVEPMSAWRYSEPQTKKFKEIVFMPRKHDKDRAMWRGLSSLIPQLIPKLKIKGKGEFTRYRIPGVISFYEKLLAQEIVSHRGVIPVHAVGIEYGAQEAVVSEHFDDVLNLPAGLLAPDNKRLVTLVRDAMEKTEEVAKVVRQLGGDLIRARGGDSEHISSAREKAGVAFYLAIDEGFPRWLASLDGIEPETARGDWRNRLRSEARRQKENLVDSAPPAAYAGRGEGRSRVDVGLAMKWFDTALNRVLPKSILSKQTKEKDQ